MAEENKAEIQKSNFVHLHVHSEYSLLDGAARIEKLVKVVKEMGMPAIALTDHGNMYGTIAMYDNCKKAKIKPIFGTEFYVCDDLTVKSGKTKLAHLIILAKDKEGYHNLCMLNTIAFRDGFYYKPRIDYKALAKHSKGLVCLSACVAGDLPQLLLKGMYEEAKKYAQMMKNMFAEGDYYIEVQDHGLMDEKLVYSDLVKIARELNIKTVATNDVHYIYKEDAEMQDVLMCVQMAKTIDDPDRMKFDSDQLYLKSKEEMEALFPDNPECIATTMEIMEKCNFEFDDLDLNKYYFPEYKPENGQTTMEFFKELIETGLIKRYGTVTPEIRQRADAEYNLIVKQGFVNYFLTVWDYIHFAKESGIPVGPGRGSGAGSVVAYAMEIVDIDPLKYDLLFERFLHNERVTAPDFDIDFADNRRAEVIEYCKKKYTEQRVAKIITFGTMAAKNAIKDVGRVLGVAYSKLDAITKDIPSIPAKHNDVIKKAFGFYKPKSDEPQVEYGVRSLIDMYNSDPEVQKVVDLAMKLEGMPRQCSTHACGILIGVDILDKYMPLSRNGDDIMTQYNMVDLERLGHLKMDFLGLRNLNDITLCLEYIKENHGVDIDFSKSNYDDPKVFEYISTGNTEGVFQLESGGFKRFMKDLQPTGIEDIVAAVALYRPGPIASIPKYVHNKHNPQDVTYAHPILENTLNITYGCIVYQEQVMRIVQDMAGYTLGQADMVRRMMGKKKVDAMKAERAVFIHGKPAEGGKPAIDGAIKRGVPEEVASQVWSEMEHFAEYAFNKSHAAAYALISYQTAYLKRYYETEFLTAVLNNRITKSDEIKHYINYAKTEDIEILPPDINESDTYFKASKGNIRFGLAALKGVGETVINTIITEREKNGKYTSLQNYCERVDSMALNKRTIEGLVYSGAFDSFGLRRSQMIETYPIIVDRISSDKKIREQGQISMFENLLKDDKAICEITYPNIKEYPLDIKLKYEKEVAGIYISGHPLDNYYDKLKEMTFNSNMANIEEKNEDELSNEDTECYIEDDIKSLDNMNVVCGGIITEIKKIQTKKGNRDMCFAKIEDLYGTLEIVLFPAIYDRYKSLIKLDNLVTIYGKTSYKLGQGFSILVDKIIEWNKQTVKEEEKVIKTLYLKYDIENESLKNQLTAILTSYKGESSVILVDTNTNEKYKMTQNVNITNALLNELCGVIGENNIKVITK